jgi:DNA repair protein RadC
MKTNLFNQGIAEIKVTYSHKVKPSQRPKVCGSKDACELLREVIVENLEYVEEFYVMLLNRANHVLGIAKISEGGLSSTVSDPKRIFQVALKSNASSIVLAHNHPSGNLQPSEADIKLTRKLKDAGTYLDLPILDHIILTSESYYSFADEGLI